MPRRATASSSACKWIRLPKSWTSTSRRSIARALASRDLSPRYSARLVNEAFGRRAAGLAEMKVTAPPQLIRNARARPDQWETEVINDKLLSPGWPKDQVYAAVTQIKGKTAYRTAVPEYYGSTCLTCHGTPKGRNRPHRLPEGWRQRRRSRRRHQHHPVSLSAVGAPRPNRRGNSTTTPAMPPKHRPIRVAVVGRDTENEIRRDIDDTRAAHPEHERAFGRIAPSPRQRTKTQAQQKPRALPKHECRLQRVVYGFELHQGRIVGERDLGRIVEVVRPHRQIRFGEERVHERHAVLQIGDRDGSSPRAARHR